MIDRIVSAILGAAVLLVVVVFVLKSCGVGAQPPELAGTELKLTALMAARVAANETAIATQCVPWERRERCVNDLGMIIQRTRGMAGGRSLYDELRRHSPRATGRCLELRLAEVHPNEWPRRCRLPAAGNVRWSPWLRLDGREPETWRDVVRLPWSMREGRWVRLLQDASRLLRMEWEPCEVSPETWGGVGDVPWPGLYPIDCGPTRNIPYARLLPGDRTLPASIARGRR